MRIVPFSWTRHGTDDILVRYRRKGCPKHLCDILIPMGAWCSNTSIEPLEYAAKATGDTKPIRQNRVWRVEAALLRKSCREDLILLTKAFLWVPRETVKMHLSKQNLS